MTGLMHALPWLLAQASQLRQRHQRRRLVERIARACGASRSRALRIAKNF